MEAKVVYITLCRYVPDILRDEYINIGVLAHIPKDKWCHFYKAKHLARIKHYDDEIELEFISVLLESLEYQFNTDYSDSPALEGVGHRNFLKHETSYFVNQIQFSEIRTLTSENVQQDIQDLYNMYLNYDKKKSDRINKERV